MYTSIMKNLLLAVTAIVFLNSCSQVDGANPSQNKALNTLAGKTKKTKSGYMQQALDSWIKDEWTPTVEKNEAIKKKNENKSRRFTIQEYVDKAKVYSKEHSSTSSESHIKKINAMPVIGTDKR